MKPTTAALMLSAFITATRVLAGGSAGAAPNTCDAALEFQGLRQQSYRTLSLIREYQSEPLVQLSQQDLDAATVQIVNQRVVASDGTFIATAAPEKFLYVMTADGTIYLKGFEWNLRHSHFLGGQPVAAAGEIDISHGVILAVNNRSGHYLPSFFYFQQFLHELGRRGYPVAPFLNKL